MTRHLSGCDNRGLHKGVVHRRTMTILGQVAGCLGEGIAKLSFEINACQFAGQFHRPRRITENLDCLGPRDLFKKPATTGKHQLTMPLHLKQAPQINLLCIREFAGLLPPQEAGHHSRSPLQNHFDVAIASAPGIA